MAVFRRRHGSTASVPSPAINSAKNKPASNKPHIMATRKVIKRNHNQYDFGYSLKLSETNTMRLLELYKGEPCLYDVNNRYYINREMRAAAARRIADALAIDGFGPREVVTKFKNLRNSYSQEMKKLKYDADGETFGVVLDEENAPKVYWFGLMDSYLRPFLYHRSRENNKTITQAPTATGNKKSNSLEAKQNSLLLPQVKEEVLYEVIDPLEISDTSETEISQQVTKKRKKMTVAAERPSGGQQKIIVMNTARQNASSSEQGGPNILDLDEHEVVGINVTKKLTRMDPTQAVYAESLIHQVLVKGLLNQLSGSTSVHDFFAGETAEERDIYNPNLKTFKYENRCASPIDDHLSSDDDIREVLPATF